MKIAVLRGFTIFGQQCFHTLKTTLKLSITMAKGCFWI